MNDKPQHCVCSAYFPSQNSIDRKLLFGAAWFRENCYCIGLSLHDFVRMCVWERASSTFFGLFAGDLTRSWQAKFRAWLEDVAKNGWESRTIENENVSSPLTLSFALGRSEAVRHARPASHSRLNHPPSRERIRTRRAPAPASGCARPESSAR